MITLNDYYRGRDLKFPLELTEERRANAVETVKRVNLLLTALAGAGVAVEAAPQSGSPVTSGWRPASINASTPRAALRSKHMTCQACDIYDPAGDIDEWCYENQTVLAQIGLWLEHPSSTKGWCHVQTVPPGSGRRVFYP